MYTFKYTNIRIIPELAPFLEAPEQFAEMLEAQGHETGGMAFPLLGVHFFEIDEEAGIVNISEFVVDAGPEIIHGRREVHVGVYQRRDIDAQLLDLPLEDLVVFP